MTAVLLALGAAVGWGSADFLAGRASRLASAALVLSLSQLVGLVAVAPLIAFTAPRSPTPHLILNAALSGVFLAVALGSLYEGMRVGQISLVAPIGATAAAVPVAYGLANGETLTSLQAGALVITLVGIVLASTERSTGKPRRVAAGVVFALVGALAGGVNIIFLKTASASGVLWTLFFQRLTVGVLAGGFALFVGARMLRGSRLAPAIVAIGVVDVAATGSFAASTTHGELSVVSVIGALYPVVTILLAFALLRERLSPLQQVGTASALAAVGMLAATSTG